ncbi:hemin uptake protein HemP [Methylovorus glucosotrophus]|nr:hemin uptake protein HemP [Methylovorus glucosotrophus]
MTATTLLTDAPRGADAGVQTSMTNAKLRQLDSKELFNGQRELEIAHGDQTYRLRLTRQGKLILTK